MKLELKIKGIPKTVTFNTANTKKLRDNYVDKVIDIEELTDNKDISTREKMKKTREFLSWIEELSLKLSNLSTEDKEIVRNDVELSDKLRDALRSLLQPIDIEEKKS